MSIISPLLVDGRRRLHCYRAGLDDVSGGQLPYSTELTKTDRLLTRG